LDKPVLIYSDLIKYYLREQPVDDLEEFQEQAARALNMEERFHKQSAIELANVLAKAFGKE